MRTRAFFIRSEADFKRCTYKSRMTLCGQTIQLKLNILPIKCGKSSISFFFVAALLYLIISLLVGMLNVPRERQKSWHPKKNVVPENSLLDFFPIQIFLQLHSHNLLLYFTHVAHRKTTSMVVLFNCAECCLHETRTTKQRETE